MKSVKHSAAFHSRSFLKTVKQRKTQLKNVDFVHTICPLNVCLNHIFHKTKHKLHGTPRFRRNYAFCHIDNTVRLIFDKPNQFCFANFL